jgi:hypothetical protein
MGVVLEPGFIQQGDSTTIEHSPEPFVPLQPV